MEIITRDFINKDAKFYAAEKEFSRERILNEINFWKHLLIKNNIKKGDKIGLALYLCDTSYLSLSFAAFELSLNLVILLKPLSEKDKERQAFNPYYPLDIVILTKFIEDFYINFYSKNSNITLFLEEEIEKFDPNISYTSDIVCSPNDSLLLSTSSGTTGPSKLISHTHKFFYDLCTVNWKSLGFEKEDKILHLITFNHGSVLGVYFLPSLYVCDHHYFFIEGFAPSDPKEDNWYRFIDFCEKYNITKVQCTYKFLLQNMFDAVSKSERGLPNLTIIIISFIDPRWQSLVNQGKIKKIISVFGCTETSGPLFLPYLDDTIKDFNPNYLGFPIQDYHKIQIIDNKLIVYVPTYDQYIDTQDIIHCENGSCTFIGKNKSYRLNDIEINFFDLQDLINKKIKDAHQMDFVILVDEIYNELYIITDNINILTFKEDLKDIIRKFYNDKIYLTDLIFIEQMHLYLINTKPDREKLLDYVRNIRQKLGSPISNY